MKKRFFLISIIITFIGIIFFAAISTNVYYRNTIQNVKETLKVYVNQYEDKYSFDQNGALDFSNDLSGARVTFMTIDGKIVGDSESAALVNEYHNNREEVISSVQNGDGYAVRSSQSIGKDYIYYCKKITLTQEDNVLIRVALTTSSSIAIFAKSLPTIAWFFVLDIVVCSICSLIFVDLILKPVETIAKESAQGKVLKTKYEELKPLIDTINESNQLIKIKANDIQEKKKIESIVLDKMEHGIIILDEYYQIILINNIASRLFDLTKESSSLNYLQQDKEIFGSLEKDDNNLLYRQIDSKDYAIRISRAASAKVILITDVTEIKKLERSKNDFIANVTHEMNTPLTSIKGFAELIQSGNLSDKKILDASQIILKQAEKLTLLVKNIINYSAIEKDDLPSYPVNLSKICEDVLLNLEGAFKEKKIHLITSIEDNVIISSRVERIIGVFSNLVTNAIKYNVVDGSITVKVEKKDSKVFLEVSDTGIGIAKENFNKIYDRFYTVNKSHNENYSGYGLGLAIVKKICKQSNWVINLESELDKGTTFRVEMQ